MSLAERVRITTDRLPDATRAVLRRRWWWVGIVIALGATTGSAAAALAGPDALVGDGAGRWVLLLVSHLPLILIGVFLSAGLVERLGYFFAGRAEAVPGRLPDVLPLVCVQLAMFNEHQVAERVIRAAAALTWPRDRLRIQVLDDSTDDETRTLVEEVVASVRSTGVDCVVIHRSDRVGYKAGALEHGRGKTGAEFLALFDADFLPPHDYLMRTIPHFFADDGGGAKTDLALVQTRWGHLNADESGLTAAQSLWVDDHHTLQMSWRSAAFGFVNFTGTAGVWRASAIDSVGGWRAASLVEDCELSFRHLFAGYRTTFVKEIVVPSELPATYTAYKAQQKRWTQGWVQLQRLHFVTLVSAFTTTPLRRLHLAYHMCISWQWPIWALWLLILPVLIHSGLWLGAADARLGLLLYTAPPAIWLAVTTIVATLETRRIDGPPFTPRTFVQRIARVAPYIVINTGMLPHQFMAFCEGLLAPLHSEFERTPKSAVISSGVAVGADSTPTAMNPPSPRRYAVKVHWPYVAAEAFFIVYQLAWAIAFMNSGLWWCAAASVFVAASVTYLFFFYGDSVGRLLFVVRMPRRLEMPRLSPASNSHGD